MESTSSNQRRFVCSLPPSIPQSHPWLVISHGKHRQRQYFYSKSQNRRYVRTIPELRGQAIWAYHDEWFVLVELKSSKCSLLNLISMEKIQLPPIEPEYHYCVLSSSPDNPDCQVIFFNGNDSSIQFCKPGDDKFDKKELNLSEDDCFSCAAALNGKIYILSDSLYLFVLDSSHPTSVLTQITFEDIEDQIVPPDIVNHSSWLVESDGELLSITVLYCGQYIKEVHDFVVNRLDTTKNSWVEVTSIGKTRTLFLDYYWGMSCLAAEESGLQGNSIYFTHKKDRCLYVFDLETKYISPSLPCPDVSRKTSQFHWITIPNV